MVKVNDKPTIQHLRRNGYLKTLSTFSQFSQTQYEFYQKRVKGRMVELVLKNGIVQSKYIYEVLGNQIIKTLRSFN